MRQLKDEECGLELLNIREYPTSSLRLGFILTVQMQCTIARCRSGLHPLSPALGLINSIAWAFSTVADEFAAGNLLCLGTMQCPVAIYRRVFKAER